MVQKIHLNILLDIMMIVSLDHYVQSFLKRLAMLNTLISHMEIR